METPNSLRAKLYVTQTLGGEVLVIVRLGEELVTVRLFEDEAPDLPQDLHLTISPEHLFFYGADGERLK